MTPASQTISTPTASELLFADDSSSSSKRLYWDRSFYDSIDSQKAALASSSTLYVGNLAFTTRTAQVRALFRWVGPIQQIHMGLDRHKKTPCGFCFVQYYERSDALAAIANLSGTKLDGRVIRVELDAGFHPGRQYGRGRSGGQVRDDKGATGRRGSQTNQPNGGDAGPGVKREREDEGETQEAAAAAGDLDSMEQQQEPSAKRRKMTNDNESLEE